MESLSPLHIAQIEGAIHLASSDRQKTTRPTSWLRVALLPILACVLTYALGFVVARISPDGAWLHEFFFKRRFVQWVLLFTFFVGLLSVLARLAGLRSELAFSRRIGSADDLRDVPAPHPRWRSVKDSLSINSRPALSAFLGAVKEREASKLEAGYRIPTDITQLLPLIGFFGTVFGLSIGLYNSFLVENDSTTRSFATAIAIAFDNTLLGLALTIILFAVTSLVRRIDEHLSSRIEDLGNEALQELCMDERGAATDADKLEQSLGALEDANRRVAEMLPRLASRMEAWKDVVHATSESLANSVRQQSVSSEALLELAKDIEKSAQLHATLENTIKDIPNARDRAHATLLDRLHAALQERNRELIKGLTAALRSPRTILVTDAPTSSTRSAGSREANNDDG